MTEPECMGHRPRQRYSDMNLRAARRVDWMAVPLPKKTMLENGSLPVLPLTRARR